MDYMKLLAIIFSATGFWKLIEMAIQYRNDKKLRMAEARNLFAQAETRVVSNWVQWSQALEKRVKELEGVASENRKLTGLVEEQHQKITDLEAKVEKLENENLQLRKEIAHLTGR